MERSALSRLRAHSGHTSDLQSCSAKPAATLSSNQLVAPGPSVPESLSPNSQSPRVRRHAVVSAQKIQTTSRCQIADGCASEEVVGKRQHVADVTEKTLATMPTTPASQ